MKNRSLDIKIWMMTKGISNRQVARSYGCSEPPVSLFLQGKRTSKGLQKHMISLGCPSGYFKDGRVLQETAE
jgi:predicted XRE-type DNA-binding protein